MAATVAAVSATLYGFSFFLIPYDASDCQPGGRSYDCKNNNVTHLNNQAFLFNLYEVFRSIFIQRLA